jgi:SAM-dependent methyltransferase
MPDVHYENPKLAAIYELDSGWAEDNDFYLSLAGPPPRTILDLGCGTGLLCDAYAARGHEVTGADPSPAMLAVARGKPHAGKVDWVQSFAQDYQSTKRFDLITMTGHAFQVLLDDADILATFAAMRQHLKPAGVIAFESRNPAIDWANAWRYDIVLKAPGATIVETRHVLARETDRMTFELRYRFPDEVLVSRSELRFLPSPSIERLLNASGLRVQKLLGDWDGSVFDPAASREMIFIVQHHRAPPARP